MASISIVNIGSGDTCLKINLDSGVEISVAFDRGSDNIRTPSDIRIFNPHDITEEVFGISRGDEVPCNDFETLVTAFEKCCKIPTTKDNEDGSGSFVGPLVGMGF